MAKEGWSTADMPDQSGKTVIVTGANTGLGFQTAKGMAAKGARVIMACRNAAKGQDALDKIKAEQPDANVSLASLNLSSLAAVKSFADSFLAENSKLDILINNAGVMVPPFGKTEDGFEDQFGINHLGHFALTGHLLGAVQATGNSRIVTVASTAHKIGKINFDNLNAEQGYKKWPAYGQSKLACLMFSQELQRRLARADSPVISVAAHPGGATTDLQRHSGYVNKLLGFIMQDSAAGALPTLRAATDPNVKGGEYYGPHFMATRGVPVLEKLNKRASDEAVAARLWDVSEQMTGVSYLSS